MTVSRLYILLLLVVMGINSNAQTNKNIDGIKSWYTTNEHELLTEYFSFLSIPNTFNDREKLDVNADFIVKMMEKRGIKTQLINNADNTSVPVVYGEILQPGATKTIVFYAHYDGQPVNPSNWASGLEPFRPQLLTDRLDKGGTFINFPDKGSVFDGKWRIYGRAAADDKAGVFAIINAYEAIRKNNLLPKINIKFFFEGEEEKGSAHLESVLEHNKELLKSDLWIICDGPMPASGQKQITFGVRGDVNMHLTVFGALRPLHSGNYGNWAPNPAHKLARLLASMKDDEGHVLIDGFYDDVIGLSPAEKAALANIEDPGPAMQAELGFATKENSHLSFLESITSQPTLNINGFSAANTGKLASNIIPTTASATLDLRLVNGNDAQKQQEKVMAHIRKLHYHIVHTEPTDEERAKYPNIIYIKEGTGYNAQKTPMDHPMAQSIINAVQSSSDRPVILMPSAGGSLPLFVFEKVMSTYPITIPVVNYDNNQHGENENLLLSKLTEGIQTLASIMLGSY